MHGWCADHCDASFIYLSLHDLDVMCIRSLASSITLGSLRLYACMYISMHVCAASAIGYKLRHKFSFFCRKLNDVVVLHLSKGDDDDEYDDDDDDDEYDGDA